MAPASSSHDDGPTAKQTTPLLLPSVAAHSRPTFRQRQSSSFRYHTFPTAPPRNAGPPQGKQINGKVSHGKMKDAAGGGGGRRRGRGNSTGRASSQRSGKSGHSQPGETPLPKKQLAMLAVIALAEQTALNSISPYLPDMAATFPEVDPDKVGLYVGLVASAFALAQFATNFMWGWLSDRVGRKPIVLLGTILTAACFVAFGFCRTLWQAALVQALMGLVNGNQGVISTCLGEITDRSNQSRAFTYLPVIYGVGGITGPIVGGLMVLRKDPFHPSKPNPYPYLLPNLFSAAILMIDFVLTIFFLEESLAEAKDLPPLGERVEDLFTWLWRFTSSSSPTYTRRLKTKAVENGSLLNGNRQTEGNHDADDDDDSDDDDCSSDSAEEMQRSNTSLSRGNDSFKISQVFTRDTILLLITFLIFQLANVSYNSLYPIFAEGRPPTGRDLSPEEIGISLAFAGVITILFQVGVFGRLREKVGNKTTYRVSLAGFVVSFLLMPWIGYKDNKGPSAPHDGGSTTMGKVWLWLELGVVLIIKTVASVGGLTSALLLITNSAPSHAVLGTLNGLAQTLSAAGRAVGPFISGSVYSASTHVRPKGEAVAFGLFGGITFVGFLLSFGIRGAELEAEGWDGNDEEQGSEGDDDEPEEHELGSPVHERSR